ncbi:hypothetical protein IHN32_10895 [Deinococcus sp. 14RED07]|uniref:hypothetical protein n=1 Tax=Deinococcus sp. 14RED07 TaxID=2745874 RepID=UPI001E4D1036|nr:hypothetical protein [Deinococcus sp. 14RED07]MCD0176450.1 hypothetical protein [Deinococcus sp. 14RED07]
MKAYLRFALVSKGFLKINEQEEFQQGFLFSFIFGTSLYIVSSGEGTCYATAQHGQPTTEKCVTLDSLDMQTGEKSTRHVFEVHQNYKAVMATLAEAGRLFATQEDFIASPRGMKWIAAREAKAKAAADEGTLEAFYATTTLLDKDGHPLENPEYLPLTDMRTALRNAVLMEAAD